MTVYSTYSRQLCEDTVSMPEDEITDSECVSISRGYIVKPRRMKMYHVDERLEWTKKGLGKAAKLCGVTWAPNEKGRGFASCIFPIRIGRCTKLCAICCWDLSVETHDRGSFWQVEMCCRPKDHVGRLHVCDACFSDMF